MLHSDEVGLIGPKLYRVRTKFGVQILQEKQFRNGAGNLARGHDIGVGDISCAPSQLLTGGWFGKIRSLVAR